VIQAETARIKELTATSEARSCRRSVIFLSCGKLRLDLDMIVICSLYVHVNNGQRHPESEREDNVNDR